MISCAPWYAHVPTVNNYQRFFINVYQHQRCTGQHVWNVHEPDLMILQLQFLGPYAQWPTLLYDYQIQGMYFMALATLLWTQGQQLVYS